LTLFFLATLFTTFKIENIKAHSNSSTKKNCIKRNRPIIYCLSNVILFFIEQQWHFSYDYMFHFCLFVLSKKIKIKNLSNISDVVPVFFLSGCYNMKDINQTIPHSILSFTIVLHVYKKNQV